MECKGVRTGLGQMKLVPPISGPVRLGSRQIEADLGSGGPFRIRVRLRKAKT